MPFKVPKGGKLESLRADHKQADWTSLSWGQRIEQHHPYPNQWIVCADAHIHQGNKCSNLLKGNSNQQKE